MQVQDELKIKLEVFEGPLDLLLYLIKKDELDIYDIPIERITNQYMEYLGLMRMLDLDIAGDFLVMAATLLMIKSRMLLPPEERPALEPEEEDPRWDLIRKLVEYKKFKDAAGTLQEMEAIQGNSFLRQSEEPAIPQSPEIELDEVTIFDLISVFNDALKKVQPEVIGEIIAEGITVADKIEMLLAVIKEKTSIPFVKLFDQAATRHEIICTFLAVLELVRLHQINARQDKTFGEIMVLRAGE
ncbi:MAG: segregation/condensation protein A [Kiritimatiellae bacterium]|nr:segregation/condensation protein A [Kiritimatiellia bacterium]